MDVGVPAEGQAHGEQLPWHGTAQAAHAAGPRGALPVSHLSWL